MRVRLPSMYIAQRDALMSDARFRFIEGSTKSGKTIGALLWQLSYALAHEGEHWWVAPSYQQAKIAYRRAARYFAPLIESKNESSPPSIVLRGGSRWSFLTGEKPDGLYGEACESVVLDEASRMREETYHAVRSTLSTTRGPLVAIGNVKGRTNWFYQKCRLAEAGEPNYSYAKLTAMDAIRGKVLSQDEVDQAERDLPRPIFRELYHCEPSDDAYNPFGLDIIDASYADELSESVPVVYGVDLARSVDYTVVCGIDADGNVCDFHRFRFPWAQTRDRVESIIEGVPSLIDATGVGDPIVEDLAGRGLDVTPFRFSSSSKQMLMDTLRFALSDGKIRFTEKVLYLELTSFEYRRASTGRVTYSAPSGLHDDAVMALALAVHHLVDLRLDRGAVAGSGRAMYAGSTITRPKVY